MGRVEARGALGGSAGGRRLVGGGRSGGAVVLTCVPPRSPPIIATPSASRSAPAPNSADDPALEDDEDAVRERQDLLELERDEQDRAALVALGDEPPVDVLDGAHVEAARRLRGDQHRAGRARSRGR